MLGNWICEAGGRVQPVVAVGVRGCEECDLRRLRILTCQRVACAVGAEWNKKRPLIPRRDHGPQMLRVGEEVERSLEFYRDVLR